MHDPETMTAAQIIERLGVSLATFYRMRAAGKIPEPTNISRAKLLWLRAEVEAWIAAKCPPKAEWEARQALAARRGR